MYKVNVIIIGLFLLQINLFAQSSLDTIFLVNGKKVVGRIIAQETEQSFKINTKKSGTLVFKVEEIWKISGNQEPRPFREAVYLRTGEVVQGLISKKAFNQGIVIKTDHLGDINYADKEIDSIRPILYSFQVEKAIQFKNGDIIHGFIVAEKPNQYIIVKNSNQEFHTFQFSEIDEISEPRRAIPQQSQFLLRDGSLIIGSVVGNTGNYITIRNDRYGNLVYPRNQVVSWNPIKATSENKGTNGALSEVESDKKLDSVSIRRSGSSRVDQILSGGNKGFGLYTICPFILFGPMLFKESYLIAQFGGDATLFKAGGFSGAAKVQLGIASRSSNNNTVINISPVMIGYNLNSNTKVEAGPDIYCRFYKDGSTTHLGFISGIKYCSDKKVSIGARMGIYNHFFIGATIGYELKNK